MTQKHNTHARLTAQRSTYRLTHSTRRMLLVQSITRAAAVLLLAGSSSVFANDNPVWSEQAWRGIADTGQFEGRLDGEALREFIAHGNTLFNARFTTLDGVGRPLATQAIIPTKRKRVPRTEFSRTAGLDANACSSCHNVPVIGGAGDFSANVFVSEGFVHSDFDSTDPQYSNERNTNHLFGAGLVELLAREMSSELIGLRSQAVAMARTGKMQIKQALTTKGVNFGYLLALPDGSVDPRGIQGVDQDLVVRPFSHKGVMTSLRQFTVNALNHHHGIQAPERFGPRWTGEDDFDGDGFTRELSDIDVSALVAWQATLAPPAVSIPESDDWKTAASQGEKLFKAIGCDSCHKPYLALNSLDFHDPGPVDAAGTLRLNEAQQQVYDLALLDWADALPRNDQGQYLVPLFGDLKRHAIADQQVAALGNELLSQRFVERNVFMTTELWGVASTSPYGHRGDMTTLAEVIDAHGGQARSSRDAWQQLPSSQRSSVIAFLKTLIIE